MKNKLAGLFEVLGILTIGWTLTRIFIGVLNVPPLQDYLNQALQSDAPNYLQLSQVGFVTLLIQFICLISPAYLLRKFLAKSSLNDFGFTKGTESLKQNLLIGVLLFCAFGIPMKVLLLLNHFIDLGAVPSYWEIFNKEWGPGFWLFMAVGSYFVIPIFEEIFYRGYCQRRLETDFAFFAVVLASLLFTCTHFQYFIFDWFNAGMLVSLLSLALAMGLSRFITKSIIAPIMIHALMNIPLAYPYDIPVLILMIITLILLRKPLANLMKEFSKNLKEARIKQNAWYLPIIVLFALGMNYLPELTVLVIVIFFVISLSTQILTIRRKPTADA